MTVELSLKLDGGNIPLNDYARALDHFARLLESLTAEVAGAKSVNWEISRLQKGSAIIGVRGVTPDIRKAKKIEQAYLSVGSALHEKRPIPYSESVATNAAQLTRLIGNEITAVLFSAGNVHYAINEAVKIQEPETKDTIGSVTGEVNAIWKTPIRIAVVDEVTDRTVHCNFNAEQEELARNLWGCRVTVIGYIERDPQTGCPVKIKKTISVTEAKQNNGALQNAQGILQRSDHLPEQRVRRLRNNTII